MHRPIDEECGEEPSVEAADSPVLPYVEHTLQCIRVPLSMKDTGGLHWWMKTVVLNAHADEVPGVCCQAAHQEHGTTDEHRVLRALAVVSYLHKKPELHLSSEDGE